MCKTPQEELEEFSEEIAKILAKDLRRKNTILMIIFVILFIMSIILTYFISNFSVRITHLEDSKKEVINNDGIRLELDKFEVTKLVKDKGGTTIWYRNITIDKSEYYTVRMKI